MIKNTIVRRFHFPRDQLPNVTHNQLLRSIKIKRKKVAFIICAPSPSFNIQAFKYFILSVNHFQKQYEFFFPDLDNSFQTFEQEKSELTINRFKNYILNYNVKYDYCILLNTTHIANNLFSDSLEKYSLITTYSWEKYFSPPSIFEYLLNSSIACILYMNENLDLYSHDDTRGCVLDYTRIKHDDRVDIAMGYICDDDREIISSKLDNSYLKDIEYILSRKWIGTITEINSVAYNLKRYFKFDIEKDSGLKKSFWEKSVDSLAELPKEFLIIIFGTIITILLFIIGIK